VTLQGNLRDFSLADMFRLLANGHKTGTLYLEKPPAEGRVCFEDGRIFFATSNWNRESLGQRLVQERVITEKQLRQALGLQKIQRKDKAGRRLGQILVDEGYLDDSVLQSFIRDQIADTLFDLLRWDEGTLRFEPGDAGRDEDIGVSVSVENVILSASRRLEEWERIKEKVPLTGAHFAMAPAPGDRASGIRLKPEEWALLRHLHGDHDVPGLVDIAGLNEFEVARLLYGLISAGLVDAVTEEAPASELAGV
jgi:hypothetical protein